MKKSLSSTDITSKEVAAKSVQAHDLMVRQGAVLRNILDQYNDSDKTLVFDYLKHVQEDYSRTVEFNQYLQLLTVVSSGDGSKGQCLTAECQRAKTLLSKVKASTRLTCRTLAHLCNLMTLPYDFKVYRGVVNNRADDRKVPKLIRSYEQINAKWRAIQPILKPDVSLTTFLKNINDQALIADTITDRIPVLFKLKSQREDLKKAIKKLKLLDSAELLRLTESVGNETRMSTFQSTSLSQEIAKTFLYDKGLLLEITVPAGQPFWYVTSRFFDEYEVVLPPCARLVTTSISYTKDTVRARYIGVTPQAAKNITLNTRQLLLMAKLHQHFETAQALDALLKKHDPLQQICVRQLTSLYDVQSINQLLTLEKD